MEKIRSASRIRQVLPDRIRLMQRLVQSPGNAFSSHIIISFQRHIDHLYTFLILIYLRLSDVYPIDQGDYENNFGMRAMAHNNRL